MDQATQIACGCDLTILSGDDSLTLPLMSIGGKGVVSVVANLIPKDMKALVKAFNDGKLEEALTLHKKLFSLCKDLLGVATNPIPVKAAMRLLGRDTGEVRLPLYELDEAGVSKVSQSLKTYGLL
jgi:4-hydroxy-tetrahydrodipicolinate synthase